MSHEDIPHHHRTGDVRRIRLGDPHGVRCHRTVRTHGICNVRLPGCFHRWDVHALGGEVIGIVSLILTILLMAVSFRISYNRHRQVLSEVIDHVI